MNLVRRVQTLEQRSLALRPPAAAPVPLEQPADVLTPTGAPARSGSSPPPAPRRPG